MTRIVNLSAGGDPFLSTLVMRLWKDRWYDEVDRFIVNYNNHAGVPQHAVSDFLAWASRDPKVDIIYHPTGIGNGMPIKEGMLLSSEDSLIMLLEDDGFIFATGKVDECFKVIETGQADAVGSARGSCGLEVTDAMVKKYNIDISGIGDRGVNYWPNFFFCKRKDLLATDLNFASKKFGKGEYFVELDHTFAEDNYGDTFVWADIQMRYHGVRFADVPQWHASPEELDFYTWKEEKWKPGEDVRWIHGGSLSAGWGGYLTGSIPDVSTDSARWEIESRVAFWRIAVDTTAGYTDFRQQYSEGIQNLVNTCQLSVDRIQKKYEVYRNLLKL